MSKDFRKEVLTFNTKESFKEVITFIKRSTHHLKNREREGREGRRKGRGRGWGRGRKNRRGKGRGDKIHFTLGI